MILKATPSPLKVEMREQKNEIQMKNNINTNTNIKITLKPADYASAFLGVIGFLIFMIAGSALTGYLAEWERGYYWFGSSMAPNTAVMGILTGIGFMLLGYKLNWIIGILKSIRQKLDDLFSAMNINQP